MHCQAVHDGGTLLQWARIVHVQQSFTMSAVLALSTSSMEVITVSESEAAGLARLQVDACMHCRAMHGLPMLSHCAYNVHVQQQNAHFSSASAASSLPTESSSGV